MLYKLFDIRRGIVFMAKGKTYVILNQKVEFQEVRFKVRYTPFGKIYHKSLDNFRDDITAGRVTYEGFMVEDPDDFNLCIGLVFYNQEVDKFYSVIGGGRRNEEDTCRFVEADKMLYGWKKKEVVYNLLDKDLKAKQAENKLWWAGWDKELQLI